MFGVAFAQAPGRIAFDTKLDLALDPAGFLARAAHLWDGAAGFGQVQNQAIGYAFPMGPFFALGDALGLPAWVIQRLWLGLLLTAAMWGMARLAARAAHRLRAGLDRRGRGVRALAVLHGPHRLHQRRGAARRAAAWSVVPLVAGAEGTLDPRRAAGRSGLVILLMGGVNATSVLAVLTFRGSTCSPAARPRRRRLMGWWAVSGVLACLWWFAALIFQARYGLSIVDYTETPQVTESTTAAAEVLRGAGNWLGYLNLGAPWVPASWTLVASPGAILGSALVAAAGIVGLIVARFPERRFALAAFLFGAVAVGAGYTGRAGGVAAEEVLGLLAGPLAAFRNVYKFEPVLLAASALGLAHLASRMTPRATVLGCSWPWPSVRSRRGVGRLPTPGGFRAVPAWWTDAARWLGERSPANATLLLPGSGFAENVWGRPIDEPMQALQRGPWVTRTLQPLGGIGSTRVLDDLERRIVQRRDAPGLRATLRRAGIRFVVARNDLDWRRTSAPRPLLVRDALRRAGLRRVARFGPSVPALAGSSTFLPDLGIGEQEGRLRMLEIYAVDPQAPQVTATAADAATVIDGGPESVAQADDAGITQSPSSTVLAADLTEASSRRGPWVVSDALRRARTDFGLVRDNTSYTLAAGELAAGATSTPQFLSDNLVGRETVALPPNVGGAVTASSYGSWLLQLPELQPANAFDRNADTVWVAGDDRTSQGQWVQASLPAPRSVEGLKVRLLREGRFRPRIVRLRVITDGGARITDLRDTEQLQPVAVAPGVTRRVRVVLDGVVGERRGAIGAGLRDVYLPSNVGVRRFVAPAQDDPLARSAGSRPRNPAFLFTRLTADPFDLLRRDEEPQLRREFVTYAADRFRLTATVRPAPGPRLDALLHRTRGLQVRASSSVRWPAALPGGRRLRRHRGHVVDRRTRRRPGDPHAVRAWALGDLRGAGDLPRLARALGDRRCADHRALVARRAPRDRPGSRGRAARVRGRAGAAAHRRARRSGARGERDRGQGRALPRAARRAAHPLVPANRAPLDQRPRRPADPAAGGRGRDRLPGAARPAHHRPAAEAPDRVAVRRGAGADGRRRAAPHPSADDGRRRRVARAGAGRALRHGRAAALGWPARDPRRRGSAVPAGLAHPHAVAGPRAVSGRSTCPGAAGGRAHLGGHAAHGGGERRRCDVPGDARELQRRLAGHVRRPARSRPSSSTGGSRGSWCRRGVPAPSRSPMRPIAAFAPRCSSGSRSSCCCSRWPCCQRGRAAAPHRTRARSRRAPARAVALALRRGGAARDRARQLAGCGADATRVAVRAGPGGAPPARGARCGGRDRCGADHRRRPVAVLR